MISDHWILDEDGKIVTTDLMTWAVWFEKSENRIVKQEHIGKSKISTVFLGLDHNFGQGDPILWETMVFGGKLDQEMDRCGGTKQDAEAMHGRMIEKVKNNE